MQEAELERANTSHINRLIALGVALGCVTPLVIASMLTPSSTGTGTHTQMGLPDCGFKVATGYPCATCGCTTAFAHAAEGSLLDSLMTQPFGALLALALAMVTLVAVWAVFSGASLAPLGRAMSSKQHVIGWVVVLLLAWAYKAAVVALAGS